MKPLLIAEAANPEWTSVPLVGWSLAQALQQATGGHIVTQIRNRAAFLRAGLVEGEDFTAIDSEAVANLAWKVASLLRMGKGKGWTMVTAISSLSYPYFENLVWKRFGEEITAGRFDVVHRITPLTPTADSPIARKCRQAGIPFLLGPLNGGIPWPPGFDAERRREQEWLSYVRGVYKLLPGRSGALAAASAIIVGSRYTASEIPARHRDKCVYIPENAIDPARFTFTPKKAVSTPLRACFIGRMVPYKGPDMLIEAAAPFLRAGRLELDMVGDGPMIADLKRLVSHHSIEDRIRFHGQVPHEQVQHILGKADLFPFPSIREFGGGVVLEAMALGIAPIVVDYGGPGELVTHDCGILLPIGSRRVLIAALGSAFDRVIAAPDCLLEMGERAAARVWERYTWERKAAQVLQVYDWVLGQKAEKPDPFGSANGTRFD